MATQVIDTRSGDLWRIAADGLSSTMRGMIEVDDENRRAALETVLYHASAKRKECVSKQWKVKKRNGDIIILRDVYEKIIKWVDGFRAVGDAVSSQLPVEAAIPWAVVSFLVKTAINDSESFAAMVDGLEKVTSIISRYAIVENIYFLRHASGSEQLRSAIVRLYASVLTFLGMSHQYFSQGTAKRIFTTVLRGTLSQIEDSLAKTEALQLEADRCAHLVGMEVLQRMAFGMESLAQSTSGISMQLIAISSQINQHAASAPLVQPNMQQRRDQRLSVAAQSVLGPLRRGFEPWSSHDDYLHPEERREIFDWLSPVRYRVHHIREGRQRLPQSGEWMFESPQFLDWKNSSVSGTLWLHGMPGSGKTKLASAVIDRELDDRPDDDAYDSLSAPLAYFYCSRNRAEPERADTDEILRCIARQLCRDKPELPICEALKHLYGKMGKPPAGQKRPPLDLTVGLIMKVLQDNPATIVIDALDECDVATRYRLFEVLDALVTKSSNIVKVFLTSRNDGDIVCRLSTTPNIYIDAHKNRADIARFVHGEVQNAISKGLMLNGNVSDGLRTRILFTLDQRAHGTFRWVSLQVQNLCDPQRMRTEDDIQRELDQLPETLGRLYELAFSQILGLPPGLYSMAIKAFVLVLVAIRPISWPEMLFMLSNSSGSVSKSQLLQITSNFLEDSQEEDRPRLAHSSAREYLESLPELRSDQANVTMSLMCLDSIQVCRKEIPDVVGKGNEELLAYPFFYLAPHLAGTTSKAREPYQQRYDQLLISLPGPWGADKCTELFRIWRKGAIYLHDEGFLHLNRVDTATMCRRTLISATPLITVCATGLYEYLRRLMPDGGSGSLYNSLEFHWPLLSWTGHQAINWLRGKNCLEMTVILREHNIIREFAAIGVDLNRPGAEGETALHLAAKLEESSVMETLLACGADPNSLSGTSETNPDHLDDDNLPNASHHRQETEGRYSTMLMGEFPKEPMRNMLAVGRPATSMGFRTFHGGKSGVTSPFALKQERCAPIHLAVANSNGGLACVETLIRFGADVNMRTSGGNTPLQLSLDSGKATPSIVRALLRGGAHVNATLDHGQTLLHLAAAAGAHEVVQAVVEFGGDPFFRDALNRTPFELAVRLGHWEVAKILSPDGARAAMAEAEAKLQGQPLARKQPGRRNALKQGDNVPIFTLTTVDATAVQISDVSDKRARSSFSTKVMSEWNRLRPGS